MTYTLIPSIFSDSANWKHFATRHEAVGAKAILERKYGPHTLELTSNPPVHSEKYSWNF